MTEGQALVVDSQEVQYRGVEIVNVDLVFDGAETEGIGCAICRASADASAGEEDAEAVVVVVAAVTVFAGCGAAELAAPENQGFIEQAAAL